MSDPVTPVTGDVAVRDRLVGAGWAVSYVDDDGVTASAADNMDLVLISGSADEAKVSTTFTASDVAVLTWNSSLYDELGLATTKGEVLAQTKVDVTTPGHQIAAGNTGLTTVYTTAEDVSWGAPDVSADVIATVEGDSAKATVFAYEIGDTLTNSSTAPARRVAVWPTADTADSNSTDGWDIFDAATNWVTSGTKYGYDASGRRTTESNNSDSTNYSYNARGQLDSIAADSTTQTREYTPGGLIDELTINDGGPVQSYSLVWDNQLAIPQLARIDTPLADYAIANGAGRAFTTDDTGLVETFDIDPLGNTIGGPSGLVRAGWYWADGVADPGAAINDVSFGPKSELLIDDLLHLRARDLDLGVEARFLTVDPLAGQPGTPVQNNPYHYANNNAVAYSDPTGMRPFGDTTLEWLYVRDANGNSSALIKPSYVTDHSSTQEYLSSYRDQAGLPRGDDGLFAPLGDVFKTVIERGLNEYIHSALDIAGMFPGAGAFFDGVNMAYYMAESDWLNAAIASLALIPIIGVGVATAKKLIIKEAGNTKFNNVGHAVTWIKTKFSHLFNKAPNPTRLTDVADDIRTSGVHPAAQNQRTIAVGQDGAGNLYAGSSNGFDAGQRAALETNGVRRVPGSGALHAEEELLRAVPDLQRVGTSVRSPCGPSEHNCLRQLIDRGVFIE